MSEDGPESVTDDEDTPLQAFVAGAVTTLTLLVAFGLLWAGVSSFWIVFIVGFAGVLPMAMAATKWYESRSQGERAGASTTTSETEAALETLRNRYARGELSEAEFERQVERLLETETVTDARTYVERGRPSKSSDGSSADGTDAPERDRESDPR